MTDKSPNRFDLSDAKETMMAVVTTGNGGYDKLVYREVPMPVPDEGEILLKVLAAGVNNTEINTRLGWYSSSVTGSTDDFADDQSNIQKIDCFQLNDHVCKSCFTSLRDVEPLERFFPDF